MLLKSSSIIADCQRRAADARERAHRATTAADRQFYEQMEKRWERLAQSHGFGERMQLFLREHQRRADERGRLPANGPLSALSSDAMALLEPGFKRLKFESGKVLWEAGAAPDRIYFPQNGAISLSVVTEGGRMAEVGLIGPRSAFGFGLNAPRGALARATVRIGGSFAAIAPERVYQAAEQSEEIKALIAECVGERLLEAQQIAACNAVHDARARLARMLLQYFDCTDREVLPLTQDELAQALGVYRTTVTSITESLKEAGLISYKRGKIVLLDRDRLSALACECYRVMRGDVGMNEPMPADSERI